MTSALHHLPKRFKPRKSSCVSSPAVLARSSHPSRRRGTGFARPLASPLDRGGAVRASGSSVQCFWQLPYSAFGDNKPTGPLLVTTNPTQAVTNQPYLLRATTAQELNLRFPGQYFDSESNLNYNYFRSYQATQGRYTQADPIGLDGGVNRFGYVGANPMLFSDALGLQAIPLPPPIPPAPPAPPGVSPGPGVASPSAEIARRLEQLFCPEDPSCTELRVRMEAVATELRVRYVEMTADARNLYCQQPIGRFSWQGHQIQFNAKRRQLQKLIEEAHKKGCTVRGDHIVLAAKEPPLCPVRLDR